VTTGPDLETLLRAGPPDEPSSPRPLILPAVPLEALRRVAAPSRPSLSRGREALVGAAALVIVGVVLAYTLGLGAPASGPASGTAPSPRTSASSAASATESAAASASPTTPPSSVALGPSVLMPGGFSFRAPVGWQVLQLALGPSTGSEAAIASFDLRARCGDGPAAASCVAGLRLAPGEIVVTIASDDNGRTIAEVTSPGGPDAQIDGMPAVLQVVEAAPGTQITGVQVQPGCDAHRAWWIARPSAPKGWLDVEACSARADRSNFRDAVDAIARSVVFMRRLGS